MWFLFDENLSPLYAEQLKVRLPDSRIARVGDLGMPIYGTKDPVLLRWCENNDAILVTGDRATMPWHVVNHIAGGRHLPGVLVVRPRATVPEVLDTVELIFGAVAPDELRDQCLYIPV